MGISQGCIKPNIIFSVDKVARLVDQGNKVSQVVYVEFESFMFSVWTYRKMNIKRMGGFSAT